MNATAILWYVFKVIILPAGVIIGMFQDSASMSQISQLICGYTMSHLDLLTSDNADLYHLIIQVITAPVTLVAWMMPEGSSVFMLGAALFGQMALYVVITLLCWAIAPPRFLVGRDSMTASAQAA